VEEEGTGNSFWNEYRGHILKVKFLLLSLVIEMLLSPGLAAQTPVLENESRKAERNF